MAKVSISDQMINLEGLRATGPQEGEEMQPEENINTEILMQLESMGFPTSRCRQAIEKTNNAGLEEAMNWLLENTEEQESSNGDVQSLVNMGFSEKHAERALKETVKF